jgi:hypothetical protein
LLIEGVFAVARPKKDSKALTFNIERSLVDKMNIVSNETDLAKTAIVERALRMYFEQYSKSGKV